MYIQLKIRFLSSFVNWKSKTTVFIRPRKTYNCGIEFRLECISNIFDIFGSFFILVFWRFKAVVRRRVSPIQVDKLIFMDATITVFDRLKWLTGGWSVASKGPDLSKFEKNAN